MTRTTASSGSSTAPRPVHLRFTCNGRSRTICCPGEKPLTRILRDDFGFRSVKDTCSTVDCGLCTVLVGGTPRPACSLQARDLRGRKVTTLEGTDRKADPLNAVRAALAVKGFAGCGFCLPNLMLRLHPLLGSRRPREEILDRDALREKILQEHFCPCGIGETILDAAEIALGRKPSGGALRIVRSGQESRADREAVESDEFLGKAIAPPHLGVLLRGGRPFLADQPVPEGSLHVRALRSPVPRAVFQDISLREGRVLPEGVLVFRAKDIPGENRCGAPCRVRPILAVDRVRYAGQCVALVASEDDSVLEEAKDAIALHLEMLPAALDVNQALMANGPAPGEGENVAHRVRIERGNLEQGFDACDLIIVHGLDVPVGDAAPIDPPVAIAIPNGDGSLKVRAPVRDALALRDALAQALDLNASRIVVHPSPCPGLERGVDGLPVAFEAALVARLVGRPAIARWSREETFLAGARSPEVRVIHRWGVRRDGKIVAAEIRILVGAGAFSCLGKDRLHALAAQATGPYDIANVRIEAAMVLTNTPPAGGRGEDGEAAVAAAVEAQVDHASRQIGMEPVAFRRINLLMSGSRTAMGKSVPTVVNLRHALDEAAAAFGMAPRHFDPSGGVEASDGRKKGRGASTVWSLVGRGLQGPARAVCELEILAGGRLGLHLSLPEAVLEGGSEFSQIAAAMVGVKPGAVKVSPFDEASTDRDGGTPDADGQIFLTGNAIRMASEGLHEVILGEAARRIGVDAGALRVKGGKLFVSGAPDRCIAVREVLQAIRKTRKGERWRGVYTGVAGGVSDGADASPGSDRARVYAWASHLVEVDVDPGSLEVRLLRYVAAHHAGRVVHPEAARAAVVSGVLRGASLALGEVLDPDPYGRPRATSFRAYGALAAGSLPSPTILLLEDVGASRGWSAMPLRAAAVLAACAAVRNAVAAAVGIRLQRLPLTPGRLRDEIQAHRIA